MDKKNWIRSTKVFLYDDTVKNNICIDVDKINHNKIKEVLKLAELEDQDHFINKNVGDGVAMSLVDKLKE